MTAKMTTIQVSVETKNQLVKLGLKGDSYDGIIRGLLDELNKKPAAEVR